MDKVLYLPLKKQWFEMIKSGKKTKEYREITPYWISRLMRWFDIDDFCPSRFEKISPREAQVLANERELLFYGIETERIILAQPKIVEFSLGYPAGNDYTRRFRMRVKGVALRIPKEGWVPEETPLNRLCICIDLGEMIEE